MRKVKFTQENYHERLTQIVDGFPHLDDIHPFYADLINVLYSRDHYKLALGQITTARSLIDSIAKDYLRMLKFPDSLYRCKQLKRAALGRMCTVVKKLSASLLYLEQVRQHLSRLPSIDPSTRTLLITGFPNVGKSSFVNKISRANVDVQPYAFTTKSLHVGHTDFQYMRFQAIDTPGILDHPLEDRNTIEMQSITALAHLHCTVLFFVDISETCGYSLEKQISLFKNIQLLFSNKPLLIVATKIDLLPYENLDAEYRDQLEALAAERGTKIMTMSNMSKEGISSVKEAACRLLIRQRVERKLNSARSTEMMGRILVTRPEARDEKTRPSAVPESVKLARAAAAKGELRPKRKLLKEVELEHGGPGIYNLSLRDHWDLEVPEWKDDHIPEIMDGKNVADFYASDAVLDKMLDALEQEEQELLRQEGLLSDGEDDGMDQDTRSLAAKVKHKQAELRVKSIHKSSNTNSVVPRKFQVRKLADAAKELEDLGLDTTKFMKERSHSRGRKRHREPEGMDDDDDDDDEDGPARKKGRTASKARSVSKMREVAVASSLPDEASKKKAKTKLINANRQFMMTGRASESDRRHYNPKPKHLFSGKRGVGKTDRR